MTVTTASGTTSYPAVGNGGLTEVQWAEMWDSPDAVIDYTGTAFNLTVLTDAVRLTPGLGVVNGYRLKTTGNIDLPSPAPGSGSLSYVVAIMYDPALNVADGSGNADPSGPCRLIITDAALDTSTGQKYLVLYTFPRLAGQAMSSVTINDNRHYSGPSVEWSTSQPGGGGEGAFPRGSLRWDPARNAILIRTLNQARTALEWKRYGPGDTVAFAAAGGLVAFGSPAEYYVDGADVQLLGSLKRSSNAVLSTGNDVILGTMPSTSAWGDLRPSRTTAYVCYGRTSTGVRIGVPVRVGPDGKVIMEPTPTNVQFVDISCIRYRAIEEGA